MNRYVGEKILPTNYPYWSTICRYFDITELSLHPQRWTFYPDYRFPLLSRGETRRAVTRPPLHAMHSGVPLRHDWLHVFVTAQTLSAEWSIVRPLKRTDRPIDRPTGRIPKYFLATRSGSQWSWATMRKLRSSLKRNHAREFRARARKFRPLLLGTG